MWLWHQGTQAVQDAFRLELMPIEDFTAQTVAHQTLRVSGTAVFLTRQDRDVPAVLIWHLLRNKSLHANLIVLTVAGAAVPWIDEHKRLEMRNSRLASGAPGQVLGSVNVPFPATDFSSFFVQAQASKADVIGLANAGGDTVNAIKQASEFGVMQGGQKLAGLLVFITDVNSLGLQAAQGLLLTEALRNQRSSLRGWHHFETAYSQESI